ncbi:MAG TPA: hypothetical protein VF026_29725, partial [Ktedonobacteraceae bacterium]
MLAAVEAATSGRHVDIPTPEMLSYSYDTLRGPAWRTPYKHCPAPYLSACKKRCYKKDTEQ